MTVYMPCKMRSSHVSRDPAEHGSAHLQCSAAVLLCDLLTVALREPSLYGAQCCSWLQWSCAALYAMQLPLCPQTAANRTPLRLPHWVVCGDKASGEDLEAPQTINDVHRKVGTVHPWTAQASWRGLLLHWRISAPVDYGGRFRLPEESHEKTVIMHDHVATTQTRTPNG